MDAAQPPGVLTGGCGLERARAPAWPSAAGRAGCSSATSTPWVVEARDVGGTLGTARGTPSYPTLLGLCTNVRRRSRARTSLHRAAARTCCARPCSGPIPSPWRGPSHSRDRGLVTAWRLAPPATVQVVGGDSNPPPTPPSPLVHILTCPVPVAWQVNLPLHLLQVLFNASFYISHHLLAADRSRNRSRATAAAATCRRPRHRPCPASSRRAGTAARPAHPPRRAAAAGAIDAQACRAARGAVSAAVSLPRRRRRRRWTARMRARNGARSTGGYTINIIMYGRPRACAW